MHACVRIRTCFRGDNRYAYGPAKQAESTNTWSIVKAAFSSETMRELIE